MGERSPGEILTADARELLDELADVVFVLDERGGILHANRRALELYGYALAELQRMTVYDLDAGTRHKQSAAFATLVARGEVEVLDLHHRTKEGRLLRMSPHARRARLGGRDVILSVVRRLDEAQRRDVEIERRLRDLELSRDIARAVSQGAPRVELARRAVRGLRAATGLAAAWVVEGPPGGGRVLAADGLEPARVPLRDAGTAATRAALGLGEVVAIPLRSASGAEVAQSVGELVVAAAPGRDVDGDVVALAESVAALVGARLASEELIEELARAVRANATFRRAFDESPEPGLIGAPPATIDEVNPAFERTFGWTAEDFRQGKTRFVSREELLRVHEAVSRDGRFDGEVHVRRKDGVLRTVALHVAVVADETGPRHVGTLHDVTDDRVREESARHVERLESLGVLAGGVAHDFNNLLAAQLSMLAVLKRRADASVAEDVIALEEVTMRAATLARQLLLFARGGTRHRETIDVGALVAEVVRLAQRTFPPSIMLEAVVDRNLPAVVGDAGGLVQVLLNFAVNARDAMPEGGHLRIEAEPVEVLTPRLEALPPVAAGRWVRLAVIDDGVGMPSATRSRIFEPFFTTKASRGSGLGMSVAYGVIRDLGGSVAVTSEPGHGTRVEVYLPPAPV